MNQDTFLEKLVEIKKEYRAVCYSKNGHWNGNWRQTYSEAFADTERHRNANHGHNKYHDVRIMARSYHEASVD